MTANEARLKVRDKYKTILGRNKYSQAKRSYVFKKASDGKYYSDCSSSVTACYRECGYPVTYGGSKIPNTVGIYNSKDVKKVAVKINEKTGVIENPEVLRVGDMLLFAGDDSSRSGSGYVGHVEMVADIASNGKVTIYGHGSGTPRATEMNAYCKSRRKRKSSTKLGHRGLIKVVRRIPDDSSASDPNPSVTQKPVTGPCVMIKSGCSANIRTGPETRYKSVGIAKAGDVFSIPDTTGWKAIEMEDGVRWISEKYVKDGIVTGETVNVRTGPGTNYKSVATGKKDQLVIGVHSDTWTPIVYNGSVRWVSNKFATVNK